MKSLRSGNVVLGAKRVAKSQKEAKLVIYSNDCPAPKLPSKTKTYHLDMTSRELGRLCKKPFSVSALAIIDEGDSDIMGLLESG